MTNGVYRGLGRVARGNTNRIVVDKPILVRSVNGAAVTKIHGTSLRWEEAVRCAYIAEGGVVKGFTLANGCTTFTSEDNSSFHGGGAFIDRDGLLSDCVVVSNAAFWCGGGICCFQGGTISNCTVQANFAYGYGGGGIYCYDGGLVMNCMVAANLASNYAAGGGIKCEGNVKLPHVQDCIVRGHANGGGVSCVPGDIYRCTISGNTNSSGGGLNLSAWSSASNCIISGNTAEFWGGGVRCVQNTTLNNCLITGNRAGSGGGLYYYRGGEANNCTIVGNTATNKAGGIYCDEAGLTRNCIVWHNDLNGVWSEWFADTNPTNLASRLAMFSIANTNGLEIHVRCTNSRIYSFEYVENLTSGTWSNVPGQTNLPGAASGVLSAIPVPVVTQGYFRIKATKP